MAPRVLISDKMSHLAEEIFKKNGVEVDVKTGLDREQLIDIIDNYDGLAVRSATKVTLPVLKASDRLRVIGRAGIGVDNIDIPTATEKGVIVMNTPHGNSITTAEHAVAMMMALARDIPAADISTQSGKWEKSKFLGVELTNKTLGIIGCGNIGSIVADRAVGLRMKVIAYDPFLSPERAIDLGVEKVELDNLFERSDFITLHTPLTDKTREIINRSSIDRMRAGVRVINCARGGLIDEAALKDGIESGKIAGAALDVFSQEPAKENILFGVDNVICTPHLGAATTEAQENVAIQIAEQMSDYLVTGGITNALNFPSISAEEAPKLKPFVILAEQLGSFAGQLVETGISAVRIEFAGEVADMNVKALTSAAIFGVLKPFLQDANMVSAPALAKQRGIAVEEITRGQEGAYENYMRLSVLTERQERSVAGTVFSDGKPRVIQVRGVNMETELAENILYVENSDQPGCIGGLGVVLGDAGINVATFSLGRESQGGKAIALVETDVAISDEIIHHVRALPQVVEARRLSF
ncbi:MAG: phosphoglycerate dehydrogenase [Desulfobulbia bacterium]